MNTRILAILSLFVLSLVAHADDKKPARDYISYRTASEKMDRTGTTTYVKNNNTDSSITVTIGVTNGFTGKSEGQVIKPLRPGQEVSLGWVSDFSPTLKKNYKTDGAEFR